MSQHRQPPLSLQCVRGLPLFTVAGPIALLSFSISVPFFSAKFSPDSGVVTMTRMNGEKHDRDQAPRPGVLSAEHRIATS